MHENIKLENKRKTCKNLYFMFVLNYPTKHTIKEITEENINRFNYVKTKYLCMSKSNTQKLRVKSKLKEYVLHMTEKNP